MIRYSINDLEQLTGIRAHTLRIWEKRYNIVQPQRTCTNIRFYTDCDLKKLLNISILNKHGYKISDIARLKDEEITDRVLNISMNPTDFETQIDSLVVAMIELDEVKFEKILSGATLSLGFEQTITRIIFPFFHKVGVLWQVGSIIPAQEHFISNLMRQKLIVGIDSLPLAVQAGKKTFILFLHEKELHEIGLLAFYYLLKRRGHRVIYLGQSVPYDDLIKVAEIQPPYALVTSFTTNMPADELSGYLERLRQSFPQAHIYASGLQLESLGALPHDILPIRCLKEFSEYLDQLPD